MKRKIGLLYCESLTCEIEEALSGAELPDLISLPYPRHCFGTGQGWNAIDEPFHQIESECGLIIIIGCGCMTSVILPEMYRDSTHIIIPNLFSDILLPETLIESYLKEGAYLIVSSNLIRWDDFFRCQGFEPDIVKQFLAESIRKIICVDMLHRPVIGEVLDVLSATLGIPAELIPVGIKPLHQYITVQYQLWQSRIGKTECDEIVAAVHRKSADYAMMVDLLGEVTTIRNEEQVIEKILDLFTLLFSPYAIGYLRVIDPESVEIVSRPSGFFDQEQMVVKFFPLQEGYGISDSGTGFFITISHDQIPLGLLVLEDLTVPDRLSDYLDLSPFIIKVCGLALINARRFQQIEVTVQELGEEIIHRKQIEEALHLANKKLNLLSSVTRHDILNSLNAIQLYLDYSQDFVKDDEKLSGFIKDEIEIAETIQHQIEFTRYYEEIGITAPQWQNIVDIIQRAADSLELKNITLQVNVQNLAVFCDSLIDKVFYNLIENTLRHGKQVTTITISYSQFGKDIVLMYADDGVGVSVEEKDHIFEKGFGKHTGFGMFLTKEILSITGVLIQENGIPGEGVRFEMIIPEGKYRINIRTKP